MAERNLIERLDQAIDAILAGRTGGLALADPELAMLLIAAADLRDLPDPRFKAKLKSELTGEDEMTTATTTAGTLKPGFHTITPYILGTPATELIDFLRDAFGGEEKFRAPDEEGKIMHAEVRIGNTMVELSDGSEEFPPTPSSFHVYVEDVDAAYARALAAGATSLGGPVDQPYGDREAGVVDRFGNQWFIARRMEEIPEEEMMRRFSTGESVPLKPTPGVGPAPEGFWTVNTGARVVGAERLIAFVKDAFGGEETSRTPTPDGKIMHAELRIGDSVYEVSDAHGPWQPMRSVIHLWVDDVDATYARAVRAGATTLRPPVDTPYGERNAAIADPLGNHWYIARPL